MVVIVHEVEVGTNSKTRMGVGIAQFVVIEAFGMRQTCVFACSSVIEDILLVVIATRFAVSDGEGSSEQVTTVLVGQARLGVEEMEVHFEREVSHIFVVHAIAFVANIAVLEIGLERKFLLSAVDNAPVGFGIDNRVCFAGVVAVIFVRIWAIGYWQWDIFEVVERAKVVT